MFNSRAYEESLKHRIRELENILCPYEQHDFVLSAEAAHVIDSHGTTILSRRYICRRCLKVNERDEYA